MMIQPLRNSISGTDYMIKIVFIVASNLNIESSIHANLKICHGLLY